MGNLKFDYEKLVSLLEQHNWRYEYEKSKAGQLQGWREREAILDFVNEGPLEARCIYDVYLRAFGPKVKVSNAV